MSPIQPAPAFPAAKEEYSREDEAAFRAQVKAELQRLRATVDGLPINAAFFSVRDYVLPGTTDWLAAFSAADDAAVAAGGIVLVPNSPAAAYDISDSITMLAPIMFAGGIVKPANGKSFTAENTVTALAGEWFDGSAGGTVTRPGGSAVPANQENGAVFDGSIINGPNHKTRIDGDPSGDTYYEESSADVWDFWVGGTRALRLAGGVPNFGAVASITTETVTDYLSIKDEDGNDIKLAIVS